MPDYSFEPQSKILRTLVLSPFRQSGWGPESALPDAAMTRIQRFDGSAVIDLNPSRRSDAQASGKGSFFATNGQVTMFDLSVKGIKCEMSSWIAGWVFAFCMGRDIVTSDGDAAPYTHTFTFDESTRVGVPTTVWLEDTDGLQYKSIDMHVSTVTATIDATGSIQLEFDMIGTGYLLNGMITPIPDIPDEIYILGSDNVYTLNQFGDPTASFVGRAMNATLKLDWQSTVHRAMGGGLYGLFIRKEWPKFSLTTTIAAKNVDDVFGYMQNNVQIATSMLATSNPLAQFGVQIPKNNFKTAKMAFDSDMIVWNTEQDETTCYQAAGVPPITVTVVNDVPAYLLPFAP